MPAVKKSGKPLCLTLSGEATIVNVEADTSRFSQSLEKCATGKKITIDASQVREMDTAYLQLVRCLFKSAQNKGIEMELTGLCEPMTQLARLYGLVWNQSGA